MAMRVQRGDGTPARAVTYDATPPHVVISHRIGRRMAAAWRIVSPMTSPPARASCWFLDGEWLPFLISPDVYCKDPSFLVRLVADGSKIFA
jgi:hypothetical protein